MKDKYLNYFMRLHLKLVLNVPSTMTQKQNNPFLLKVLSWMGLILFWRAPAVAPGSSSNCTLYSNALYYSDTERI